jgi:hypothetical protein
LIVISGQHAVPSVVAPQDGGTAALWKDFHHRFNTAGTSYMANRPSQSQLVMLPAMLQLLI